MNYLSLFDRWQLEKYQNMIPEQQDRNDEYESRHNIESTEPCEWLDEELIDNNNQQ